MPLIRKDAPPAPGPPAGGDLPERLAHGSPEERWQAARALGGGPGDVARLGAALAREDDPRVREALLTSLAKADHPAGVDAVLPLLRSDDAGLRTGALDALAAMRTAAAPRAAELLGDPDVDVRILACEIVRRMPAPEATRLLATLLEAEPDVNVCGAAVDVLAEAGTPEALPALARCAERFPDEDFLRFSIRVATNRIASAGARPS